MTTTPAVTGEMDHLDQLIDTFRKAGHRRITPAPRPLMRTLPTVNPQCILQIAALVLFLIPPAFAEASEIPGTEIPYATYRRKMLANGFKPATPCASPPCGGPFPETITGNRLGSAYWIHLVDGMKVDLLLWPCKHGWCLAPPVMPLNP